MAFYQDPEKGQKYTDFLASKNGQIQKQVLLKAILHRLPQNEKLTILDAACGSGWLAFELYKHGYKAFGCDQSENYITQAKEMYPEIDFATADIAQTLPYQAESFDAIILNMAAQDLESQPAAFQNLRALLRPQGRLITTIANPYYAFPIGVWKRGWTNLFLGKKPELKTMASYNLLAEKKDRTVAYPHLRSQFYPLSEILNNFLNAGLRLNYFQDLKTDQDDPQFSLQYQLYRFPLILLLEFIQH
jgi:SAM-dependent methyltransferase